jgi:hypothetical protein
VWNVTAAFRGNTGTLSNARGMEDFSSLDSLNSTTFLHFLYDDKYAMHRGCVSTGAMGAIAPTNFEKGVFGTHVAPTKI